MPEAKKIVIGEYKRKVAGEAIYNADVIFCLVLTHPELGFSAIGLQNHVQKNTD
jgi:hypothetical protein